MNEETEALAYSQLLLLHADTITDSGVKEMVVNSAAELTILHLRVEALRLENERLREALEKVADASMSMHLNAAHMATSLQGIAKAALRRDGASDGLSAPSGPACHATDNGAVGAGSRRGATSGPTPE